MNNLRRHFVKSFGKDFNWQLECIIKERMLQMQERGRMQNPVTKRRNTDSPSYNLRRALFKYKEREYSLAISSNKEFTTQKVNILTINSLKRGWYFIKNSYHTEPDVINKYGLFVKIIINILTINSLKRGWYIANNSCKNEAFKKI